LGPENISATGDRFEGLGITELLAQVRNRHPNGVGERIGHLVPNVLEKGFLGQHLAGVGHQIFEQGEFLGSQSENRPPTGDLEAGRVEIEVADREDRISGFVASQQRPRPRRQLGESEWFYEVVVGTGIETGHPILDVVTSREHQDARAVALETGKVTDDHTAAQLKPGTVREVPIENGQVVAS
jgi:hypothetical protein